MLPLRAGAGGERGSSRNKWRVEWLMSLLIVTGYLGEEVDRYEVIFLLLKWA